MSSRLTRLTVVVGFVASAYLTLPLVAWQLLTSFSTAKTLSDRAFIAFWRQMKVSPSDSYTLLAQKCVLMISNQQLVTGLAVLGAGFSNSTAEFPHITGKSLWIWLGSHLPHIWQP